MDSTLKGLENGIDKQIELRKQISTLQNELEHEVRKNTVDRDNSILAPKTPSPKKRKISDLPVPATKYTRRPHSHKPSLASSKNLSCSPLPSKFLLSLPTIEQHFQSEEKETAPKRSSDFAEHPIAPVHTERRDDRLAVIENLELGPKNHKPPSDDPKFERLEPHSGIYLSERRLSHNDLQEYLTARYYLSPSTLYSVVRPLPSKQGYDVPVEGDWVTIAVIAERGPVRVTMAGGSVQSTDTPSGQSDINPSISSRKYLTLKLVDLGSAYCGGSSTQKDIKGDALLNLLLFEATSFSKDISKSAGSDRFAKKVYKGGSGGAYEACASLREGTVLAILNPRVLKPFKRGNLKTAAKPDPRDNILAISPTSAAALLVIGQARDLGFCTATKKDGKTCGSWVDKRSCGEHQICEWHFNAAVQTRRAARAEFSTSTSSMTGDVNVPKFGWSKAVRKSDQTNGLLPSIPQKKGADGEALYMYSGSVIRSDAKDQAVAEKIGRGRQERLKRKRDNEETEAALAKLAQVDGGGTLTANKVRLARASIEKQHSRVKDGKKPTRGEAPGSVGQGTVYNIPEQFATCNYTATLVNSLGFNPSKQRNNHDEAIQQKLEKLQSASVARIVELKSRHSKKKWSSAHKLVDEKQDPISTPSDNRASDSDIEIEPAR